MLKGKEVLVTGATGFIGGRLVEKLFLEQESKVRALVRNFGQAARIARFPINMYAGDLTNLEALNRAVAGCNVVFHLAYDPLTPKQNIDGIRNLAEACLQHGVQRLVQVSTMAVYDFTAEGVVTEETPPNPPDPQSYTDIKLAVEQEALKYWSERGLPVTVIQPTIVYGPFSDAWTMQPVSRMLTGTLVLPDDKGGTCNLVYIDDVVDALIIAAECEKAVGERFLISGSEPMTWQDFFAAYERIVGIEALKLIPEDEIRKMNRSISALIRQIFSEPKRAILKWPSLHKSLQSFYGFLPNSAKRLALKAYLHKKETVGRELHLPDPGSLVLYKKRGRVSIEKAYRILGYMPAYSNREGFEMTAKYIRWAFLPPPSI